MRAKPLSIRLAYERSASRTRQWHRLGNGISISKSLKRRSAMLRTFSSVPNPHAKLRELKRHVLRLYKHIHPDRLGRFPRQRAVNENSFQILQSAIDRHFDRVEARVSTPPPAPQPAQQLTFFAHGSAEKENSDRHNLTKAVIHMHESRLGHALVSLFKELGLEPPPQNILPGTVADVEGMQFSSLRELIKHARQVEMELITKKNQATVNAVQRSIDDEVVVTRLALQRSRGVQIVLGTGLPVKLERLFRRLSRTIRTARNVDLSTSVIELDGGFEVELNTSGAFPFIKLGACASEESWLETLGSKQACTAAKAGQTFALQLREMEAALARTIGVRLVMHDFQLVQGGAWDSKEQEETDNLDVHLNGSALLRRYQSVLRYCTSSSESDMGVVAIDGVGSLALMFTEGSSFHTDVEQGVLRVGIDDDIDKIMESLKTHGAYVNSMYERKRVHAQNEEKRLSVVRRALGIRSIRRTEEVSGRDWDTVLTKLQSDSSRLRKVFDGTAVVIGTQARLLVDSGEVEIPHDYDQWLPI